MREDIERYLADTSEATAKAVATGTGFPQLDVTKELNRMLGDGLVEREKRAGGGNEYVYWLAGAAQPAAPTCNVPAATAKQLITEAVESLPPAAFSAVDNERVIADLRAAVERLSAERDAAQLKADTWRANAAALEARIDELTLGPVGAHAPLFVTVGRNCKPQRHESLEKAQRRGRALVRSEKESEVLVLEPVGRIVRGTEWMPR
ncbi:1-pyrroline-5-carboxylate dehydrogenase [Burkholderia sp. Tr-862]|uniref:1-pyrroline-5-carboxylate dehydrogenase n=1 Tax=Burkholderia sp. Tr-862 TaxID=2608331 RepID=UPI001419F5D6|nr:1-pyrroline-5-carboxylate dehydrogenase [Burkholderia sp. Tr-862]NIF39514.1 1-pyrroline-5-carboxylate dehydrogenase [Burkholderia sp. Tr-862]